MYESLENKLAKIPIVNNYKTPKTLGDDRLANVVGASVLFPNKNVLTIDCGTCIKFDLINKEKQYNGGAISLGLKMRFEALNKFTANLPLIKPKKIELKTEDFTAGKTIELPAVQFYGGTAQFLPGATKILDQVIPVLKKNPNLNIEIAGHICCGNQMELSIERAYVVYNYFIDRGVPRKMLTYKGYNNTQPKYGNIMDYRNRRVELIVLD